jgi:hypothetical protein
MARYNEILVGRFNRALQKLLSIKGEPPAPQLATDFQPSISFPLGAEFRYLESWGLFGGGDQQAATATVVSGWRLRNPVGSNMIGVIQLLKFSTGTADLVTLESGVAATDLSAIVSTSPLDSRCAPKPVLILSRSAAVSAPGISQIGRFDLPALTLTSVIDDTIQELPVLPGRAVQIRSNAVNLNLTATFQWRERPLEEGELI